MVSLQSPRRVNEGDVARRASRIEWRARQAEAPEDNADMLVHTFDGAAAVFQGEEDIRRGDR